MSRPVWHAHPDRTSCSVALARVLVSAMRVALADAGRACLLLPGGQSPVPLLRQLAGEPVDWTRIALSPTDERWVAANDPASNLQLLRATLPQARLLDPRQGATPELAAQAWGECLASRLPLTAVLLGMGEDGHVASLFPGMAGLDEALDEQAAPGGLVGVAPVEPRLRLTPNLSLLLHSDWLGLLVFGAAKRQLIEAVLAGRAETRSLPVHALARRAGSRLHIHWAP